MPSIMLVRHAQASFGGADYDVLSERGRRQAAALADDLARRDVGITRVVSGTLARQRDTVEAIAGAAGTAVEVDSRWDEYDADEILSRHSTTRARQDRPPGSDAPEISSRDFQDHLEAALLDWIEAGEDGPAAESWPVFAGRTGSALTELGQGLERGETALVCTSGGVLSAICIALLGAPHASFVRFNRVTVNAALTRVAYGGSGATLVSFNEQAHLERRAESLVSYR